MITIAETTYSNWASSLSKLTGKNISKQAIFKRITPSWVNLMKLLVKQTIEEQILAYSKHRISLSVFNNIYVQDSTTISLPNIIKTIFPGNMSKGEQKAVAKINAVINLTTGLCCHLSVTGFTTNEQKLSGSILEIAKAGDLVIRDMGYFVLEVFKKMHSKNIYFISRLKYGVSLFKNNHRLNLLILLKNKSEIDLQIECGKEQLPVRLIAVKLSQEQASERIRKAKKDRDRRLNHSKEYYESLKYVLMITNIEKAKCNATGVTELYRIRWQIEILFKSWKSCFKLEHMIPLAKTKTECVESIIYMLLLFIIWFEKKILSRLNLENLSIMKLSKEVIMNLSYYLSIEIRRCDIKHLQYRCKYEKRVRVNASERLGNLVNEFG